MKDNIYCKKLDLIRIWSCILVLLYHLNLFKGGFLAVCVFFALSGYLSCMQAIKDDNFSIKKYYISRIKKLYVPLVVVTFITVILASLIPKFAWVNLKRETMSVLFGYNNYWQINANLDYFVRNIESPFKHLWYISILMQFDLLFPLFVTLFKKISSKIKHFSIIAVLIITIAALSYTYFLNIFSNINIIYYETFARVYSILFGILLSLITNKYRLRLFKSKSKFNIVFFVSYLLLFTILCFIVPNDSSKYLLYMILTSIIGTRLIEYSTTKTDWNNKKNKLINGISNITYEVYLIQYPLIYFFNKLSIPNSLELILTLLKIIVASIVLHFIINYRKNKIFNIIKYFMFASLVVIGSYYVIVGNDYTKDMEELKNVLDANQMLTEKKNEEFLKKDNIELIPQDIINSGEVLSGDVVSGEEVIVDDILEEDVYIIAVSGEELAIITQYVSNLPVVGIGDSVLLGSAEQLYKKFPNGYFDGKVSRTMKQSEEIIQNLIDEGKLNGPLVLALANNGDYSNYRNNSLMAIIGDREVYWVNAVLADDPEFNDKFAEYAKDYPNIHVVDWEKASKGHEEYFYKDGIHLKPDGQKAYSELIYKAILTEYAKKGIDIIYENAVEVDTSSGEGTYIDEGSIINEDW